MISAVVTLWDATKVFFGHGENLASSVGTFVSLNTMLPILFRKNE